MLKSAAVELGSFGIRVNSDYPGFIETRMLDEFETPREELAARSLSAGRLAYPKLRGWFAFFESDDASHSSCHEFVIDRAMKA